MRPALPLALITVLHAKRLVSSTLLTQPVKKYALQASMLKENNVSPATLLVKNAMVLLRQTALLALKGNFWTLNLARAC